MTARKDILEFGFHVGRHIPGATPWHAERLLRYGAGHKRLTEADCNRGLTPDEQKRLDSLRKRVLDMALSVGSSARFSGDPRGATIKLACSDGFTNDWGKVGLCVPTS